MTTIGIDDFIIGTIKWAECRSGFFKYMWPTKGGWEAWIQIDLTAFFLSLTSTAEIQREYNIYKNDKQRVDLLLNPSFEHGEIPIEIKAESLENYSRFEEGVKSDKDKLEKERNDKYKDRNCILMAMAFSPEGREKVMNIRDGILGHTIFHPIIKPDHPSAKEIVIMIAVLLNKENKSDWIPAKQLGELINQLPSDLRLYI